MSESVATPTRAGEIRPIRREIVFEPIPPPEPPVPRRPVDPAPTVPADPAPTEQPEPVSAPGS